MINNNDDDVDDDNKSTTHHFQATSFKHCETATAKEEEVDHRSNITVYILD